jgi:hypothetical protein
VELLEQAFELIIGDTQIQPTAQQLYSVPCQAEAWLSILKHRYGLPYIRETEWRPAGVTLVSAQTQEREEQ